jgi:mannose-6-phosphate isomerase-like protein (cupin superfamily)
MNVQEYIDSGVLHDYCMNVLSESQMAAVEQVCAQYPEVKQELTQLQKTLENYAGNAALAPGAALQENIWNTLDNINKEKAGDLNDLPVINKYSDHNNWKRIVIPFMPKEVTRDILISTIRESAGVTQMLVISKTDVAEEVHENERESFLVLEGECECCIGDNLYHLGPGGFIEIPLHTPHNVRVLSPYVVAVLQHVAV